MPYAAGKAPTESPERPHADGVHFLTALCIKNADNLMWKQLEGDETESHNAKGHDQTGLISFHEALFVFGSVVISQNWQYTLVQAECRHENK